MQKAIGLIAFVTLATVPATASAQDAAGCWAGTLGSGPTQIRAAVELARSAGGWTGTIHRLGGRINSDTFDTVAVDGGAVSFTFRSAQGPGPATFTGTVEDTGISGDIVNDRGTLPVRLARVDPLAPDPAVGLAGYWSGGLFQGGGLILRLGLEFVPAPCGQVLVTMDSPDQGGEDIPVSSVSLSGDSLAFEIARVGGSFSGTLAPGWTDIEGVWTQSGNRLELRLTRGDSALSFARPQDPQPPFPYEASEVSYVNAADGTRFAGTLTIPEGEGPFPAALLISGSGAQNRDEALMGHRPFLVIADHLTRHGIAVLRVDDRGVNESTGNVMEATIPDNVGDALAGVSFLGDQARIDRTRIGLIGHSEGGWVAPLAASESDDVAFVVMLAGPAVTGEEILFAQNRAMFDAAGTAPPVIEGDEAIRRMLFAEIKNGADLTGDTERTFSLVDATIAALPADQARAMEALVSRDGWREQFTQGLQMLTTPWFRYLLTYDPVPALVAMDVPALALFGELDLQVPPSQSVPILERLWMDHPDATVHVLPQLNHLFQHAETGLIREYGQIEETFAPEALDMVATWIEERFGVPER